MIYDTEKGSIQKSKKSLFSEIFDAFWQILRFFFWRFLMHLVVVSSIWCCFCEAYRTVPRRAEREGSTCPSRGEQRLTVYRAHASDSESLSALKSNMGAGQTRKISETDYV